MTAAAVSEPAIATPAIAAPSAVAVAAPAALLRTALVWNGEVMADRISRTAESITLGASARSSFVVPDLSLPADFAIIRPGNRGYLLTLSARMRGTICVDGHERDVAEFVRRGGEGGVGDRLDEGGGASTFRATAIGGRDWGVIDLDPEGAYQLFFQFVAAEPPLAKRRKQLELLLPALAFSLLLHTVLLAVSYNFDDELDPLAYPGSAALTGRFLIRRNHEPPPPEPEKTEPDRGKKAIASATVGATGRSGGKGEQERARGPAVAVPRGNDCWQQAFRVCLAASADPTACAAVADKQCSAPKIALLDRKNREEIEAVRDLEVGDALDRFQRLPGAARPGDPGYGRGTGTGVGDDQGGTGTTKGGSGDGPGGGGSSERDRLSRGKIDTGETRPASGTGGKGTGIKERGLVASGAATGDFGGLTREEIDRVVRSRQGLVRSCYQRELDHTAGLGGTVVVNFVIAAEGAVTSAKVDGRKSTLHNDAVGDCVTRQIRQLTFPAKGGGIVNYPFIFSQGT